MSHLGVNKEATEQRVPSGLLEVTFQMFYGCQKKKDNYLQNKHTGNLSSTSPIITLG
jgi:hypothetical protein